MSTDQKTATAHVQLVDGYRFEATFTDVVGTASLTLDETPPFGGNEGPSPIGLLAAAIGGCMSASLTFCLNKAQLEPDAMNANVTAHVGRNDAGRLRITGVDVDLKPCLAREDQASLDRCKTLFEDFCIISQSVRQGIPVN